MIKLGWLGTRPTINNKFLKKIKMIVIQSKKILMKIVEVILNLLVDMRRRGAVVRGGVRRIWVKRDFPQMNLMKGLKRKIGRGIEGRWKGRGIKRKWIMVRMVVLWKVKLGENDFFIKINQLVLNNWVHNKNQSGFVYLRSHIIIYLILLLLLRPVIKTFPWLLY